MGWWSKFLRLRKQNDIIKIMCLYLIIGAVFIANAVINGIRLYQSVQSPAEYVLMGNGQNAAANVTLKEIGELENVAALSRQKEMMITVKYQGDEIEFSCTKLSGAYLEKVYGIRESGAMPTFYMNEKAYGQLKKNEYGPVEDSGNGELRITYSVMDASKDASANQTGGTAKVVRIQTGMPEDEPFVFCKGDSMGLSENTPDIRVFVNRQDLDGEDVNRLLGFGYTLVNEKEVQETEYLRQMQLVKIQYGGAVAAISLTCAGFLWKFFGKKAADDETGK